MSAPIPKFVLHALYATDPVLVERRLAVRPQHLERAIKLGAEGVVLSGGPLISPESTASASTQPVGSLMVYKAENLEAARKLVEEDVYWTEGVWDRERLSLFPWLQTLPASS